MIGKVLDRGTRVYGLLRYLLQEGEKDTCGLKSEHKDCHLIGAWADDVQEPPPLLSAKRPGGRQVGELAARLEQPIDAAGVKYESKPVYHFMLRAAPGDRRLTDEEFRSVVEDALHRTGLAPRDDPFGCRWVAVRHADDHVHVAVTLARQDGKRPRLSFDGKKLGEAAQAAEVRFDLRRTAGHGTGHVTETRAEREKARRQGRPEPLRASLRREVREAAIATSGPDEFFARLQAAGVTAMQVHSKANPAKIMGYTFWSEGEKDREGKPIKFSGGELAPDLTRNKLLARWGLGLDTTTGATAGQSQSSEDRQAPSREAPKRRTPRDTGADDRAWRQAVGAASRANEEIRDFSATDPGRAADAAWAASDLLYATADAAEGRKGGPIRKAAEQYERAAREVFGRAPQQTRSGRGLRAAGRLLAASAASSDPGTKQLQALLAQLAALTDAVTRLRETQQRTAQAEASRHAAAALREQVNAMAARAGAARPQVLVDVDEQLRDQERERKNRGRGPSL